MNARAESIIELFVRLLPSTTTIVGSMLLHDSLQASVPFWSPPPQQGILNLHMTYF